MTTALYTHESSMRHVTPPGHPERVARLEAVREALAGLDGLDRRECPGRTSDEPRVLAIGRIGDKHWTGIITYRNDTIRIISIRRSRNEEIALYES